MSITGVNYQRRHDRALWQVQQVTPWYGRVVACKWPVYKVKWRWGRVLFGLLLVIEYVERGDAWFLDVIHARVGRLP